MIGLVLAALTALPTCPTEDSVNCKYRGVGEYWFVALGTPASQLVIYEDGAVALYGEGTLTILREGN